MKNNITRNKNMINSKGLAIIKKWTLTKNKGKKIYIVCEENIPATWLFYLPFFVQGQHIEVC